MINNIKKDLINELDNSRINIGDNSINFIKNNKTISIYDIKNQEKR